MEKFTFSYLGLVAEVQFDLPKMTVEGRAVHPDGVRDLIIYGIKQKFQDGAAFPAGTPEETRREGVEKRIANVIAGTLRSGGGGGRGKSTEEQLIETVSQEKVLAIAKREDRQLTKEELEAGGKQYFALKRDEVLKEVADRLKKAAKVEDDFDLGAVLTEVAKNKAAKKAKAEAAKAKAEAAEAKAKANS